MYQLIWKVNNELSQSLVSNRYFRRSSIIKIGTSVVVSVWRVEFPLLTQSLPKSPLVRTSKIRKLFMRGKNGFSLFDLIVGLFLIGLSSFLLYSTFSGMNVEAKKIRIISLAADLDSEISQYLLQTQAWASEADSLLTGKIPAAIDINLPSAIPLQHPQSRKVFLDFDGNVCPNENSCDLALEFEIRKIILGSNTQIAYAYRIRPTEKIKKTTGAFQGFGVPGEALFNDEDFNHIIPQSILMNTSTCKAQESAGIRGLDATGTPICLTFPSLGCPTNEIPYAFYFDGLSLKLNCRPLKSITCGAPGYVLQTINPAQFLKGTNSLPNFGLSNSPSKCVWSGPSVTNLKSDGTCPSGYTSFNGTCIAPPPIEASLI